MLSLPPVNESMMKDKDVIVLQQHYAHFLIFFFSKPHAVAVRIFLPCLAIRLIKARWLRSSRGGGLNVHVHPYTGHTINHRILTTTPRLESKRYSLSWSSCHQYYLITIERDIIRKRPSHWCYLFCWAYQQRPCTGQMPRISPA